MAKDKEQPTIVWRDRVKEFRRVRADEIENAPWNYRSHPDSQKEALAGSIEELGFFEPVVVYETAQGTLRLVNGQARRDLIELAIGPDTTIPTIVTDLNEAEAKKALLVVDPLSSMAEPDPQALDALMREVQISDQALATMVEELAEQAGIVFTDNAFDANADDMEDKYSQGQEDGVKITTVQVSIVCPTEVKQDVIDSIKRAVNQHEGAKLYV